MSEQEKINLDEGLPLQEVAKNIGEYLSNITDIKRLAETETPFGKITRLDKVAPEFEMRRDRKYLNKKNVFAGDINGTPVVIIHFSEEGYVDDKTYFQNIYQVSKKVLNGEITNNLPRKITPELLGYDDATMTLLIEKAPHDLGFYLESTESEKIEKVLDEFIDLIKTTWEATKTPSDQFCRYVDAFLKPEYSFLADKKIDDCLKNPEVIQLYKQTQEILADFAVQLDQPKFERGSGFSDVKPSNVVEDKEGNILFIDVEKHSYCHWLSMLGQFYQGTLQEGPGSLFSAILEQKVIKILENEKENPEKAVGLFAIGRMNRLLLPYTLRNLSYASETNEFIDEEKIRNTLAKIQELTKIKTAQEVVTYEND